MSMRFAALAIFVLPALWACESGGSSSCSYDTDCADFTQVCVEGMCQAPGGPFDSGPRRDSGGPMDSGSTDSAAGDADPGDSAVADVGPVDAPIVDGDMPCPDPRGAWNVTAILGSCAGAMMGYSVTIADGGGACLFAVTSDAELAADGVFALDMSGSFIIPMSPINTGGIPDAAAPLCDGSLAGSVLTILCGGCVMNLGPR